MIRPRIALVSIQRPIFRGDKAGVFRKAIEGLKKLSDSWHFELLIHDQPVESEDSARSAAGALRKQNADLVLLQLTTFATGEMLAPFTKVNAPLGLWAVPESGDRGILPLNSLCGLNMYTNVLKRCMPDYAKPFKWYYGSPDSELFGQRFGPTVRALHAICTLRTTRIGVVGGTAPNFFGIECDWDKVSNRFGVAVARHELEKFYGIARGVDGNEAGRVAEAMAAEAARCSTTHEQLIPTARIELALRRIAEREGYGAMALRCWPEIPDELGSMPCLAVGRLMDSGIPVACEGDVLGAIAMVALNAISDGCAMLMDMVDWNDKSDMIQLWHCGNTPREWADESGDGVLPHFNRPHMGAVRALVFRETPATVLQLTANGTQALVFGGRFGPGPTRGFDGARGWLGQLTMGPSPLSARDLLSSVLSHAMPHHYPVAAGQVETHVREFCSWLGIELLEPVPYRDPL